MKHGQPSKLDKRNTTKSKKIVDDVIFVNYDVIVIFPIFRRFGASLIMTFCLKKLKAELKNF